MKLKFVAYCDALFYIVLQYFIEIGFSLQWCVIVIDYKYDTYELSSLILKPIWLLPSDRTVCCRIRYASSWLDFRISYLWKKLTKNVHNHDIQFWSKRIKTRYEVQKVFFHFHLNRNIKKWKQYHFYILKKHSFVGTV